MTQMGLEYMKHKETARHNVLDEIIRQGQVDVNAREADTRAYVASFKPQEVEASKQQAEASLIQADVAKGKLDLDAKYRERETAAKEGITAAQMSQAETALKNYLLNASVKERETLAYEMQAQAARDQALSAADRNEIQKISEAIKHLDPTLAAYVAAEMLGWDKGGQFISVLAKYLGSQLNNLARQKDKLEGIFSKALIK